MVISTVDEHLIELNLELKIIFYYSFSDHLHQCIKAQRVFNDFLVVCVVLSSGFIPDDLLNLLLEKLWDLFFLKHLVDKTLDEIVPF